ncbi:MAG TPA: hypothetical protein PKD86_15280 [Gemmatales bacterium]|nr:hypothetical protein [Gemmatales bacterium]HMP60706.1 hypothetical protein [Gemmatales bacterium]
MFALLLCTTWLGSDVMTWHQDYNSAVNLAKEQKKDLLVCFHADDVLDHLFASETVSRKLMTDYVCLRVPVDYKVGDQDLLSHAAFSEMMGKPGVAILSLHDESLPHHREVISVHPLVSSRYSWVPKFGPEQLAIVLDLPRTATLTQRSMLYGLHVHPERPGSIRGTWQPAFVGHAQRHSARQAAMRHQHHANLIAALAQLKSESGMGLYNGSEVVAESWGMVVGGENVLEASFSCIDAWRHSSGHWGAVMRHHRFFGYDIARGANGTWYATGIYAD